VNLRSQVFGLDRVDASIAGFDYSYPSGYNIITVRATRVLPESAICLMVFQHFGGNVPWHEKGIASACDPATNGGDLTQGNEPISKPPHDFEIEVRRANISPPVHPKKPTEG
jgi:hypothetical protein